MKTIKLIIATLLLPATLLIALGLKLSQWFYDFIIEVKDGILELIDISYEFWTDIFKWDK